MDFSPGNLIFVVYCSFISKFRNLTLKKFLLRALKKSQKPEEFPTNCSNGKFII